MVVWSRGGLLATHFSATLFLTSRYASHRIRASRSISACKAADLLVLSRAVVLSAFFLTTFAWGHTSSSTVRGTVRDSQQAILPAAKVTLLNVATNVSRETQTNEAGLYVFPGVIPGPYRISVTFPGLQ